MDFTTLAPEDVLEPDVLPYYKEGLEFFHLQLAHLNSTIFVMDHVITFPYHLFSHANETLFFKLVFNNFFHASVLVITRMATDQGEEFFTLPRFKNRLRRSVKHLYLKEFDNHLRSLRFDASTRQLLRKAENLRHTKVAHTLEATIFQPNSEDALRFGDLKALRDRLNDLLSGLSFHTDLLMLPPQYSGRVQHPAESDSRSDIEKLLDLVAEHSELIRLPESSPQMWAIQRRYTTSDDLALLNRYRSKFKMPEV